VDPLRTATDGPSLSWRAPTIEKLKYGCVLVVTVQSCTPRTQSAIGPDEKASTAKVTLWPTSRTKNERSGAATTRPAAGVDRPGTGDSPKPTDQVTVNYRGTLLDGTEFDSSYKRNQPFTTGLNGVIKGWSEALLLMKIGEKVELFIPPDLAYGQNSPPPLPPNALLKFEVELLSVKPGSPAAAPPPGAAMSGPRHP